MRHYRLLTKKSPVLNKLQLTHGVHGDNEGHKYSRPITLSEHPYIANAQCDFSFKIVSNCVTFLKIRMNIGDRIRYFCNRKISAKIVNEYDQEIPQSQTADNPVAPRGRAAQPSRDTRKTN